MSASSSSTTHGIWGQPLPPLPQYREPTPELLGLPLPGVTEAVESSRGRLGAPGEIPLDRLIQVGSDEAADTRAEAPNTITTHDPLQQDNRGVPLTMNCARNIGCELGLGRTGSARLTAGLRLLAKTIIDDASLDEPRLTNEDREIIDALEGGYRSVNSVSVCPIHSKLGNEVLRPEAGGMQVSDELYQVIRQRRGMARRR